MSGIVPQLVESLHCDPVIVGSIPRQVVPKSLKWYFLLFCLVLSIKRVEMEVVSLMPV